MKAASTMTLTTAKQRTVQFTLSLPVQATLFTSLSALMIWTVFFSTYPAVHNPLHSVRHNTLLVGCH